MIKKYLLYIFDLDGTLINSSEDLTIAVNYMRRYFKLEELSIETIISYIGGGSRQLIKLALQNSNFDIDHAHTITMDYYRQNNCYKTHFYPQVLQTLLKLKEQGCKLAISTNKPEKLAQEIMKKLKQDNLFEIIMGPESSALKPAPIAIEKITQQLQISIEQTLMIGDHHTDIEAAYNANCHCCFITYGIGKLEKNQKANYQIDKFEQLLSY